LLNSQPLRMNSIWVLVVRENDTSTKPRLVAPVPSLTMSG
jgi:hypothetical protein